MRPFRSFGPGVDVGTLRVSETLLPLEDYLKRSGYEPTFVSGINLPLPAPLPGRWENDLVELKHEARLEGQSLTELKYTHFSVRMAKSRGLPLVSAVNINGKKSNRNVKRTDVWRRDPRIDARYQNLREGYGNESQGLFSRGHMTRREDPNWGDDDALLRMADMDTFHITNVAPQRQGFNAGLWLNLENYVLDNADRNDLKISVFTGPVLREDDPVYYNVRIPTEFWKIIAFKHWQTLEVTTIAYKRSQVEFLPSLARKRFVFGDFDDTQVSVADLEEDTGLNLAAFKERDVLEGAGPGVEIKLTSVTDLYMRR